jgi:hypothetical protein
VVERTGSCFGVKVFDQLHVGGSRVSRRRLPLGGGDNGGSGVVGMDDGEQVGGLDLGSDGGVAVGGVGLGFGGVGGGLGCPGLWGDGASGDAG